ncbi:hypothetical protein PENSPDRAFT_670782 [Peniophora sp. CONT]|nr:hypothetical protein PENSPDRAFT_670782 [Peniophora sp. CONT]
MNPSAPPPGTTYTDANTGMTYVWDGGRWTPIHASNSPLTPLPGTPAVLPSHPLQPSFPPGGGPNNPTPVASSSRFSLDMIDPALRPLPPPDVQEVADLIRRKPAHKKGGHRVPASPTYEGKGKDRATDAGSKCKRTAYDSGSEREGGSRRTKRGRTKGSANFKKADLAELCNIAEEVLPTGGKGWQVVGARHRAWARDNDMPIRSDKSLENKFKQLVRKPKPTGRGTCPPDIERVHFVSDLIEEKVNTRELANEDIIDDRNLDMRHDRDNDDDSAGASAVEITDDDSDSDSDHGLPPPLPPRRKAARHSNPRTKSVPRAVKLEQPLLPPVSRADSASRPMRAVDILSRLSENLGGPDDRGLRVMQSTQLVLLNGQLRDANTRVAELQRQLHESERLRHESERRADRAELELRLMRRGGSSAPVLPYQGHWDRSWEISYGGPNGEGGRARFYGHENDHDDYFRHPTPQCSPRFYRRLDTPTPSRCVRFGQAVHSPAAATPRSHRARTHTATPTNDRVSSRHERNPFTSGEVTGGISLFTGAASAPSTRVSTPSLPASPFDVSSDEAEVEE